MPGGPTKSSSPRNWRAQSRPKPRSTGGKYAGRAFLTLLALGLAGALAFVMLGSWALRTFFATTELVGLGVLIILALSTVVLMAASTLQPALVAVGGDRWVMAGWVAGSVVTGTVALLPFAAIPAAAVGQMLGPTLTASVLASALLIRLRLQARTAAAEGRADRSVRESGAALGG